MKNIDLTNLRVYLDFARTKSEVRDYRVSIADAIYTGCPGIEYHALVHKIYDNKGPIQLSDREAELLQKVAEACTPAIYDAIMEQLNSEE